MIFLLLFRRATAGSVSEIKKAPGKSRREMTIEISSAAYDEVCHCETCGISSPFSGNTMPPCEEQRAAVAGCSAAQALSGANVARPKYLTEQRHTCQDFFPRNFSRRIPAWNLGNKSTSVVQKLAGASRDRKAN